MENRGRVKKRHTASGVSQSDTSLITLEKKMSLEDIARLYGASRVAIWKYCRDVRLTRRNRSEARLEAQKRNKVPQNYFDINEGFFSKWSPEMAYVLGLVITDGCVSKTSDISLNMNEKELLEKVRNVMCSQHKVALSKHQEGLYCFHFARERLVKDLAGLGVLPRKSLNVKFPAVPDAFLKDFIRGAFDGDGSVFFEKRSPKLPLRASFISSSKDFIEILEAKLRALGMPKRILYQHKTKNAVSYMIRYAHTDSIRLFKLLYNQSTVQEGLFLARKYNKFLSGMNCGG